MGSSDESGSPKKKRVPKHSDKMKKALQIFRKSQTKLGREKQAAQRLSHDMRHLQSKLKKVEHLHEKTTKRVKKAESTVKSSRDLIAAARQN